METGKKESKLTDVTSFQSFLNHTAVSILLPAVVGLGGVYLCVKLGDYGLTLFLGLPVVVSFLSAFCWSFRRWRPWRRTYGVAVSSVMTLGGMILVFALDGFFCLLMGLPLAMILAIFGTIFGLWAARACGDAGGAAILSLLTVTCPVLAGFEHAADFQPSVRQVTTALKIKAPIEKVWETVIAFPEITEPPSGIFRLGIAYPISARIEGSGVGATRYCTFSTGSFVEPITAWDKPRLLAFDVAENPPPMREMSPYGHLDVPHLHNHLVSQKGQFRLFEKDGSVWLEGTTWYSHRIAPEFYWSLISDEIIHSIHRRVLLHIQAHSEAPHKIAVASFSPRS